MPVRVAWIVAFSESVRMLRDPHVLGYLIAPVVLYPALLWAGSQLALYEQGRAEGEELRIEVQGELELPELQSAPFAPGEGSRQDDPLEALDRGELDAVVF